MKTIITILTERNVLINAAQVIKFRITSDKALLSNGETTAAFGLVADLLGGSTEVLVTSDSINKIKSELLQLQTNLAAGIDDTIISYPEKM